MILLALLAAVLGAVLGGVTAQKRGGDNRDVVQYAIGYAVAFFFVTLFAGVMIAALVT